MRNRIYLLMSLLALVVHLLWGATARGQEQLSHSVYLAKPADGILRPLDNGFGGQVSIGDVLDAPWIRDDAPFLFTEGNLIFHQDFIRVNDHALPNVPVAFFLAPCTLGLDDLPDTKIKDIVYGISVVRKKPDGTYVLPGPEYSTKGTLKETLTLGPDTAEPKVTIVSPRDGTSVQAGEKIEVTVRATEEPTKGSWQTGVHQIKLLKPDDDIDKATISRKPKPCGDKQVEGKKTFTYNVPSDAKPGTKLTLIAEGLDFADNLGKAQIRLMVGDDLWQGTWHSTEYQLHEDSHIGPGSTVKARFEFIVGPDGTITGTGTASIEGILITSPHKSVGTCAESMRRYTPETFDVKIVGHRDGETFRLALKAPEPAGRVVVTATCYYGKNNKYGPPERTYTSELKESRLGQGFEETRIEARDGATATPAKPRVKWWFQEASLEIHRAPPAP